jgi:cathepsin D
MRQQLIALALASAALAAPSAAPDTFKIPFERRSMTNADGTVNEEALLASLSRTLVKYGQAPLPENLLSKRSSAPVKLTDQVSQGEDELYYGPVTVGSQTFTIDFDTGSADLFVPGPSCTTADGCVHSTKYNNHGQDQHKTTSVTYGSGKISGEDFKDKVSVSGLTVPHQGFISLTDATGFAQSASDGLMGMGFSTIANTGYPTFFENLIAQKTVTKPEFAFYLGRGKSNTTGLSELYLGGQDTARYTGNPKSVPVTTKGYWQVALDAVTVNGQSAGVTTKGQAAIDTGTTIVLAPTAAAAAIFALIPGAIPMPLLSGSTSLLLYAYPCNTAAKNIPKIQFAGTQFAINPLDFNFGSLSSSSSLMSILGASQLFDPDTAAKIGYCVAGIAAEDISPSENLYVVGDVFLKNWYSIYSYAGSASVSFAKAVHNQ